MLNRTIVMNTVLIALAVGTTASAAQEIAPRSITQGPSVSIHGTTTVVTRKDTHHGTAFGGGLGVAVGYGLGDRFAIHSTTTGAFMAPSGQDEYLLTHLDLEGRYNVGRRSSAWSPHLALGISARTRHYEVSETAVRGIFSRTALGVTTGGGISYHLTPSTSLDWSLRYTFGNLKQRSCVDSSETVRACATSMRAGFGATWYPFTR